MQSTTSETDNTGQFQHLDIASSSLPLADLTDSRLFIVGSRNHISETFLEFGNSFDRAVSFNRFGDTFEAYSSYSKNGLPLSTSYNGGFINELLIYNASNESIAGVANYTSLAIGRGTQGFHHLTGNISEIILYDSDTQTVNEIAQIESYLALKYGITLNNGATAYKNSAGTDVWTVDAAYNSDIFGIGTDSGSSLDQQISKSVNPGSVLTLSTDTDFTGANGTHTSLADGEFLVIGNNGGAMSTQATELENLYEVRTEREWKVQNTSSVGAVNLKFDGFYDSWVLLTDADGDFSAGTTNAGALSAAGEMTNITLADGTYMVLAQLDVTAPAAPTPGTFSPNPAMTGDTVTTISYSVTDGGPLDEDGLANGGIVDPAGPAVLAPISSGGGGGGGGVQYYPVQLCENDKCVTQQASEAAGTTANFRAYKACINSGLNDPYQCTRDWVEANNLGVCDDATNRCEKPTTTVVPVEITPEETELVTETAIVENGCKTITYQRWPERRGLGVNKAWFSDTLETHVNYAALIDLAEQGIITGDTNTNYARLDAEVARGEVAKIMTIARQDSLKKGACVDLTKFPDVNTAAWHHNFVQNMEYQDIVRGYEDGLYRPGKNITKAEIYKILALGFNYISYEEAKSQAENRELNWFVPYQEALESNVSLPRKITNAPFETLMTRGEVFDMLSRVLANIDNH